MKLNNIVKRVSQTFRGGAAQGRRSRKSKSPSFRTMVESLERRQLLAYTVPADFSLVETKTLNAAVSSFQNFTTPVVEGWDYVVVVSGIAKIGSRPDHQGARFTDAVNFDDLAETKVFSRTFNTRIRFSGVSSAPGWGDYESDHVYGQKITAGSSTIGVQFYDNPYNDNGGSMTVKLYAPKLNLILDSLPEQTQPPPNELNPGAFIPVNSDDDDGNGVADAEQAGPIAGEYDLVPLTMKVPSAVTSGTVQLSIPSGAENVKVWQFADKSDGFPLLGGSVTARTWDIGSLPGTVYVEAITASASLADIRFVLAAVPSSGTPTPPSNAKPSSDEAKATGVGVSIVNKDGDETATLKVAKWQGAFNADGTVKANFIDLDPDRFKVRVTDPGKKGAGTVVVTVATDSDGTAYDDNATEITLTETGANTGVFESKTQMLMSDDVDDDYKVDNIGDDAKDDRSHIIALGGKVKPEYTLANGKTAGATAKVPVVKKITNMQFIILREKAGGAAVTTEARVKDDIKKANERFAQVGVLLDVPDAAITIVDPPAGVDLTDPMGLDEFTTNAAEEIVLSAEEKALFDALGTASKDDSVVFYVNKMSGGSLGELSGAYGLPAAAPAKHANNMVMSASAATAFTMAHEMMHLLLAIGSHDVPDNNLLTATLTGDSDVRYERRITEAQETTILASKFVGN